MKVLITGINGRIGRYIAKELLQNRLEVVGLDLAASINKELKMCQYVKADITHREDLLEALKGHQFDTVIHLAALAHFGINNIPLKAFMEVNCEGAINVAEATVNCGAKKMLFASTVDVYGDVVDEVVNECTKCQPKTNYGKSKYEAEKKLEKYFSSAGIDYYIYRFAPVYFPENTHDLDKRVLLPKGLGAFYFGDGSYVISLCSVFNILNAVNAFIEGNIKPGTYIVSDKVALTAREIAMMKIQNGEAKRLIKLPYKFVYVCVKIMSGILHTLRITEKDLLLNNLNKLAKPVLYDSSKIASSVSLKWDVINTFV